MNEFPEVLVSYLQDARPGEQGLLGDAVRGG